MLTNKLCIMDQGLDREIVARKTKTKANEPHR